MLLAAAREAVALAGGRLTSAGLVRGTAGNVSARAGELVAVSPTGAVLSDLAAAEVPVVDLDGRAVDGDLEPTSELGMHLAVHRARGDGAVVHTHAPAATALACVLDELPCLHYDQLALGGPVRVAPYATFGTPELATAALEALGDRSAVLLSNHGTLTHGPDVAAATDRAELLEWCCALYLRAASAGTPRALGPVELEAVAAAMAERGYGAPRRLRP